jgi:hypothetical protein
MFFPGFSGFLSTGFAKRSLYTKKSEDVPAFSAVACERGSMTRVCIGAEIVGVHTYMLPQL